MQREIWRVADEVRRSVYSWDFKQYVLGALFYRFISERLRRSIEAEGAAKDYAALSDADVTDAVRDGSIKSLGYFIYPSQLFSNVAAAADENECLQTDLAAALVAIEDSAEGCPSEENFRGLFADFDTKSYRLGETDKDRNERLAAVLKGVAGVDFGDADGQPDLFGDAYEHLIANYAARNTFDGGKFFTPESVSKLAVRLAMHGQGSVNKFYDMDCGGGCMFLQASKLLGGGVAGDGFFGQETDLSACRLARMNMLLHDIPHEKFKIRPGEVLTAPHFADDEPFDAIASNPPYSMDWPGAQDPALLHDDRFAGPGVLAPTYSADYAFVLHALSRLSGKGRAAVVCVTSILYREGSESRIRKFLVENNHVEAVILLPGSMLYNTNATMCILVLAKNKAHECVRFVDASLEFHPERKTGKNFMDDGHIDKIMEMFSGKADSRHEAVTVPREKIAQNEYNISVRCYVEPKGPLEEIDIALVNSNLRAIVAKTNRLRAEIDSIAGVTQA